jgi:vancomycin permeability regulator SanA
MERVIVREKLAVVKAEIDVLVHSQPKFLGEAIPMTGESSKSWDKN